MPKIRVLLVEDSSAVRNRLREVLSADAGIEIVAEALNGAQAIDLCRQHRPDVITMDMVLPVLDGLAATETIMAHWPTPILIVSSSTNRAQLFNTYDALAAGAVDVLEKPRGDDSNASWERRLLSTVKLVSRIRVITHPRGQFSGLKPKANSRANAWAAAGPGRSPPRQEGRQCELIAIGASAGGPAAVVDVLRELPTDLHIPVLLVQHLAAPFASAFAEWLGQQLGRQVAYAQDCELVAESADRVTVAPPNSHLVVRDRRLRLTHEVERHSCRPSVDVLFESIAGGYGPAAAACLLTGMGRDGASGLLRLRKAGALTLAQDEATSMVYGMPGAAALLGAADQILPPDEIGRRLAGLASLPLPPSLGPARKP